MYNDRRTIGAINIVHEIPGRVRFKIRSLNFGETKTRHLTSECENISGVIWVNPNHKCNSLVIRYDVTITTTSVLHKAIGRLLSVEARPPSLTRYGGKGSGDDSVNMALFRFVGMSLLTTGVFVGTILFSTPLSQSLISPLGIVTTLAAMPLVKKGITEIKQRRFSLESFLGGAVIAAVGAGEAVAALEILWVTSGAELLTAWVTERSRRAIRDILDVTAKNTYVHINGVEIETPVAEVKPGDVVVIHTGEKISVDGRIIKGGALVDEAPINGRAEFMSRLAGDTVFAGTYVRQGVIYVQAEHVGDNTYLSRILKLVEESLENKAPIEGIAEELARKLMKIGFIATTATFLITRSFRRTFSVMLVMACPCATSLAASTAVSAALSAAARQHILIKGGRYLEEVGQADMICFDKTGTLTTNHPEIRHIYAAPETTRDELIRLAYSAEKHNLHPIALAIKTEAETRNIQAVPHDVCEYIPGAGIRSEVSGDEVLVGNARLMGTYDVSRMNESGWMHCGFKKFENRGMTIVFVAINRQLSGIIEFANKIRPESGSVIRSLRESGIEEMALITGDEKGSAMDLAITYGFTECYYSAMPMQKADIVKSLRNGRRKVMMVGDGINDALALAEADIGIAMGAGGSEVAIEAADIALVNDDLNGLVFVRHLSQDAMKIIRQNFLLATGTNVIGIVMGGFGWLSPVVAGLFHVIHTAGILANSGRLLFHKPKDISGAEIIDIKSKNERKRVLNHEGKYVESRKKTDLSCLISKK